MQGDLRESGAQLSFDWNQQRYKNGTREEALTCFCVAAPDSY